MLIRSGSPSDRESIRDIYHSAFPEEEHEAVATLAVRLLGEETLPETFSLLAEADNGVVAHIAFSPVSNPKIDYFKGYILAPLAVLPAFQKQGIGTALIEAGIQRLLNLNVDILFVYGDPKYYARFGFTTEVASAYEAPYPLEYDFGWQAKPLAPAGTFAASGKLRCVPALNDPQLW